VEEELWGNSAVTFLGAKLKSGINGFNHPVITLGHSQIVQLDGSTLNITSGAGREIELSLPPSGYTGQTYGDISRASCHISPIADSDSSYGYTCFGGKNIHGSFDFKMKVQHKSFMKLQKQ